MNGVKSKNNTICQINKSILDFYSTILNQIKVQPSFKTKKRNNDSDEQCLRQGLLQLQIIAYLWGKFFIATSLWNKFAQIRSLIKFKFAQPPKRRRHFLLSYSQTQCKYQSLNNYYKTRGKRRRSLLAEKKLLILWLNCLMWPS